MNPIDLLIHPVDSYRKLKTVWREGNRLRKLHEPLFLSGLQDSAWTLYGLARSLKPQVAVEIGSARGKSACFVGMALKENGSGKLYAIDPHLPTEWNDQQSVKTFETMSFNLNWLGLTEQVEIVRKMSDEAAKDWNRPIDMIFIDGDHSYEGVKRDWELFLPHMTQFCVVVFHDTTWEIDDASSEVRREDMGVPLFVDELRREGYPVITLPHNRGVSLVQTTKQGIALTNDAPMAAATG